MKIHLGTLSVIVLVTLALGLLVGHASFNLKPAVGTTDFTDHTDAETDAVLATFTSEVKAPRNSAGAQHTPHPCHLCHLCHPWSGQLLFPSSTIPQPWIVLSGEIASCKRWQRLKAVHGFRSLTVQRVSPPVFARS